MRNIRNLTKDIRNTQMDALKGQNPQQKVQLNPMSLEQLEGIRSTVGYLLQQAEKEKEDLVATCQFYSDLNNALEGHSYQAEPEDERPSFQPSFTEDE